MATHGEIRWPPVRTLSGRLWGEFHGRRHAAVTGVAQRARTPRRCAIASRFPREQASVLMPKRAGLCAIAMPQGAGLGVAFRAPLVLSAPASGVPVGNTFVGGRASGSFTDHLRSQCASEWSLLALRCRREAGTPRSLDHRGAGPRAVAHRSGTRGSRGARRRRGAAAVVTASRGGDSTRARWRARSRYAGGHDERGPDARRGRRRRADRAPAGDLARGAPTAGAARRQADSDTRPIDPAVDERPARQRRGAAQHRQRAAAGTGVGRLGGPAVRVRDVERRGASSEFARGRDPPGRSRARDHHDLHGNDAATGCRRACPVGCGGARGVRRQDHQAAREGVAHRARLRTDAPPSLGRRTYRIRPCSTGWSGTCGSRRSTRRLSSNASARCSRATGRRSISSRTTPRRRRSAWIGRSAANRPDAASVSFLSVDVHAYPHQQRMLEQLDGRARASWSPPESRGGGDRYREDRRSCARLSPASIRCAARSLAAVRRAPRADSRAEPRDVPRRPARRLVRRDSRRRPRGRRGARLRDDPIAVRGVGQRSAPTGLRRRDRRRVPPRRGAELPAAARTSRAAWSCSG